MEVNLELKCSGTKKIERLKLTVCDWDDKCVGDLKKAFQNKIDVPACDQKLSYQSRPLNDELFPLKKLYFREGDLIEVKFLSKGNLAEMTVLLEHLKKFSEGIVEVDQNQLLTVNKKKLKDRRSWFIDYDQVLYALEELFSTFFIPWKDPKSVIHRHFFVQEGAFKAFMEVLKFSSKRYRAEEKSNSKFNFGKLTAKEAEGKEQQLRELNNTQMILQTQCLSLLWNFSETAHDRRLVLQEEGLQPVIMALLLDPYNYDDAADEYWHVVSINEGAVGCLVQYAEFSDCQEIVASNTEAINKLLLMVESQLYSSQSELPETFSKYSAQIAANTLFCCACSLQTPAILVRLHLLHRMINLTSLLLVGDEENFTALRYYCTLFLARIQASPLVNLDALTKAAIDKIIESFLGKHMPENITKWEKDHHYVWVSLIPFVSLAFTGKSHSEEANITKKQDGGCIKELETMFDEEDGPSYRHSNTGDNLSCGGSATGQHHCSDSRDKKEPVESHLPVVAVEHVTCTSSTTSKVQHSLTSELGSVQTHKLGLFTLHHMLQSGENCQLLETERLFPYLECLCWHLSTDNSMLLRQELSKHWPLTPPSLAVICKSVLAFSSGFEVVLKM